MTPDERMALVRHVEGLNLTGLAWSAEQLAGTSPARAAAAFSGWRAEGVGRLPNVVSRLWKALAPMGAGRPNHEGAADCETFLAGLPLPPARLATARKAAGTAGKRAVRENLPPDDPQAAELLEALRAFWRTFGLGYGELAPLAAAGDRAQAVARLRRLVADLREPLARLTELADRLGDTAPQEPVTVRAAPPRRDRVGGDVPGPYTAPYPETAAQRPHQRPLAAAVSAHPPATAQAGASDEEPPPRPLEILARRHPRDHPFLPIVFLLLVTAVALFVIYATIADAA